MKVNVIVKNGKGTKTLIANIDELEQLATTVANLIKSTYGGEYVNTLEYIEDYNVTTKSGASETGCTINGSKNFGITSKSSDISELTIKVFIRSAIPVRQIKEYKEKLRQDEEEQFFSRGVVREALEKYDSQKQWYWSFFNVDHDSITKLRKFVGDTPPGKLSSENLLELLQILSAISLEASVLPEEASEVITTIHTNIQKKYESIIAVLQSPQHNPIDRHVMRADHKGDSKPPVKCELWQAAFLNIFYPQQMSKWCNKLGVTSLAQLDAKIINELYNLYLPLETGLSKLLLNCLSFEFIKEKADIQKQALFYLQKHIYALQCNLASYYMTTWKLTILSKECWPVITVADGRYALGCLWLMVLYNRDKLLENDKSFFDKVPFVDLDLSDKDKEFLRDNEPCAQLLSMVMMLAFYNKKPLSPIVLRQAINKLKSFPEDILDDFYAAMNRTVILTSGKILYAMEQAKLQHKDLHFTGGLEILVTLSKPHVKRVEEFFANLISSSFSPKSFAESILGKKQESKADSKQGSPGLSTRKMAPVDGAGSRKSSEVQKPPTPTTIRVFN